MSFNTSIAGKDATEAFEDVGHSDEARELLLGLLVGELEESSVSTEWYDNKEFRAKLGDIFRRHPSRRKPRRTQLCTMLSRRARSELLCSH
jgi:hypothetical protein